MAGPAFLLLAILEGAGVSRGVSPVCSCSYWPTPERCGLKHCGFLTPADLRTPAAGQCVRAPTQDVINGGGAMWEVRTGLCACPLPGSGHWF